MTRAQRVAGTLVPIIVVIVYAYLNQEIGRWRMHREMAAEVTQARTGAHYWQVRASVYEERLAGLHGFARAEIRRCFLPDVDSVVRTRGVE